MVEETIYSLLSAQDSPASAWNTLMGARIYPSVGIQNPPLPYAVFQRVTTGDENTTSGFSGLINYGFQFDIYSDTLSECLTAATHLHTLLTASALRALRTMQISGFEDETKLYRVTADYSIWSRETAISH
jgi:hypothetical protein